MDKFWHEVQEDKNRQDKRDRDKVIHITIIINESIMCIFLFQVFESINREVQKGAMKWGVAAFAVGCNIDSKRDISSFGLSFPDIPGSPLAVWAEENEEAKQSLERALTAAQLQLVMLRNAKRKGDKGRFAELLKVEVEDGEEGEEEEEEGDGLGDLTPTIPVMQMNNDQIQQYFPKLIKRMLAMEAGRGKKGRLWASSTEPAGKEKYTFLVDIDNICVISQERSACTTRRPRGFSHEIPTGAEAQEGRR